MKISKGKSMLFFLPFLVSFILFWAVPLFYGIFLSFRKFSIAKGDLGFVGLENYIKIFDSSSMYNQLFFNGLKNTLTFVAISIIPLVIISLLLALLVQNLPNRTKSLFRTIFFISYAVSVTAVSAIFVWLFSGNGGFINGILINYNLISEPIPWLEVQPFSWITILIATVWWTIGFNMMLFINALNEIDISLYEASSLDGANMFNQFKDIILPCIKNVLYFVIMTSIISSFNLYGQAKLITNGGPGQSTQSLIMTIQEVVFDKNNLAMGSAMALLMGVIVMCFSLAQYLLTKEKKEIMEVQK